MAILDLRRTDQRGLTQAGGPFWLTSAPITKVCDDKEAVLFSFPKAGQKVFIHQALADITVPFAGGTVACVVGSGTLATDDVTTGGTVSAVDADGILNATDLGVMGSAIVDIATASDLGVAIVQNTAPADRLFIGAATTVPCVYASLTSDAAITAGEMRVKLLVSLIDDI